MRSKLALFGFVAAVLVTVPLAAVSAPPAFAADSSTPFVFYGAGWGHAVGLSQYGAYGLAQQGWAHGRILEHYYTGTDVTQAPNPPATLRVGIAWDRSQLTLSAIGGPVTLRLGKPTNRDRFKIPNGYTWVVKPASGHFELHNAKGDVVDTVGGPKWSLFAIYLPDS